MTEGSVTAKIGLSGAVGWCCTGGREHCRCPAPSTVKVGPADRVDSPRNGVEPAICDAVLNRRGAESERQQLPPRHDPVLAADQLPSTSISSLRL